MILVFGGVYQGKLSYALERFGLADSDVCRCDDDDVRAPAGAAIIYELDKWLLALVKAGDDTDGAVNKFVEGNGGAVVICNDITCGVVPVDPLMRKWREAVGRALAELAGVSDEVVRLFCGIPMRIK